MSIEHDPDSVRTLPFTATQFRLSKPSRVSHTIFRIAEIPMSPVSCMTNMQGWPRIRLSQFGLVSGKPFSESSSLKDEMMILSTYVHKIQAPVYAKSFSVVTGLPLWSRGVRLRIHIPQFQTQNFGQQMIWPYLERIFSVTWSPLHLLSKKLHKIQRGHYKTILIAPAWSIVLIPLIILCVVQSRFDFL